MGKRSRGKVGARRYADYSEETLKLAVDLVQTKSLTSYEAQKQFGIPRRTILNHVNNKHQKTVGRPNELSVEDEKHIADVLELTGKFGCPLSMLDLRMVVHDYIQKSGRTHLFNGKMPGERWVRGFLERHKFTLRATQNIKRTRAAKSVDELSTYFDHLRNTVKDVPRENILNFDETNLSDDPGSAKAAYKRGTKHPERVLNSSKTSISIMFSVTADGRCLPPYVVYKSEHLWTQWCKNGPPNARYNRTKSGWFDMICFDDWFKTIVLPWANSREGPKVIIGDNLSSHLSVEVIQLCNENDIHLVFLPPNSTHLTQPLDVAFFGPMKKMWRKILLHYKMANKNVTTLNKTHFPELLQELMNSIKMSSSNTICSGFAACGIYPHDPSRVIGKLPDVTIEQTKQFDKCLLEYLEQNRKTHTQAKKTNNKKLTVVAGKSVSTDDFMNFIKDKKPSKLKKIPNTDENHENTEIFLQPNSLKSLCTNFVNKLFFDENSEQPIKLRKITVKKTVKKKTLKSVRILGQVSRKYDKENTPFTAEHDGDLPKCLQIEEKNDDNSSKSPKSKITILQDIKITPGPSGMKRKATKNLHALGQNNESIVSIGVEALNTRLIPENKKKKLLAVKPRVKKEINKKDYKINGKRRVLRHSSSSTSTSDVMSIHSDSSIMDISDEIDSNDDFVRLTPKMNTNEPINITDMADTLQITDDLISNKVPCELNPENLTLLKPNDPICLSTPRSASISDISYLNDSDHTDNLLNAKRSHDDLQSPIKSSVLPEETNAEISPCTSPQEPKESFNSSIESNDTVLVRYYSRNAWRCYIGVVTNINNDDTFDVSFYATSRIKRDLKFKKPRRLDKDTVPRESIVKVIQLAKISAKPEVFQLHNPDDAIYF